MKRFPFSLENNHVESYMHLHYALLYFDGRIFTFTHTQKVQDSVAFIKYIFVLDKYISF